MEKRAPLEGLARDAALSAYRHDEEGRSLCSVPDQGRSRHRSLFFCYATGDCDWSSGESWLKALCRAVDPVPGRHVVDAVLGQGLGAFLRCVDDRLLVDVE